ncbi:Reticulon-3 [Cichlidogyrus casuarinus]|uniref:Reticulon-like protein n=1 Tax=Cichlidogyrus casuarinus TaxID=1844966 RepID=A0ABD2QMI7_9PLAT
MDLSVSDDKVQSIVKTIVDKSSRHIDYVRRMLILENYIETAKFAMLMYFLTIVGACFNLLTLITLAFTVTMTWPKIYELYQPQIDNVFENAKTKVVDIWQP